VTPPDPVPACPRCAEVRALLADLADYFDDRADITDDGTANAAMAWHQRITAVLS